MGYSEKQVIEALIAVAKKRGIDVLSDPDFRRTAALVVLTNRGLTLGGGQRKI